MCLVVFIGSDYALPTIAWDERQPGFHVTELGERDEPVRKQFSKPCVYYLGSHEQCGCGFQCDTMHEDAAALAAKRESRRRLVEFVEVALQHQSAVELFACWDGDQAAAAQHRERLRPRELLKREAFQEKEFLLITNVDLT